ncbi:hypothetical protein VTK73DRAFT_708 [Phialemonium thermophilum]|uniref:Secreted protein n=1 Tax=Phialemonium thermophilum TaxID=223376 RepID=A0ABR3VUD8_9PEZI
MSLTSWSWWRTTWPSVCLPRSRCPTVTTRGRPSSRSRLRIDTARCPSPARRLCCLNCPLMLELRVVLLLVAAVAVRVSASLVHGRFLLISRFRRCSRKTRRRTRFSWKEWSFLRTTSPGCAARRVCPSATGTRTRMCAAWVRICGASSSASSCTASRPILAWPPSTSCCPRRRCPRRRRRRRRRVLPVPRRTSRRAVV